MWLPAEMGADGARVFSGPAIHVRVQGALPGRRQAGVPQAVRAVPLPLRAGYPAPAPHLLPGCALPLHLT